MAETNHDLSYAKTPDLVHWFKADGTPLSLPIKLSTGEIVDPVPVKGGMINNNTLIGFDDQGRPTITYHKYDKAGDTQIYVARYEGKSGWRIAQISHWTHYRWDFSGGGSLNSEIFVAGVQPIGNGLLKVPVIRLGQSIDFIVKSSDLSLVEARPVTSLADRLKPDFKVPEGMQLNVVTAPGDGDTIAAPWYGRRSRPIATSPRRTSPTRRRCRFVTLKAKPLSTTRQRPSFNQCTTGVEGEPPSTYTTMKSARCTLCASLALQGIAWGLLAFHRALTRSTEYRRTFCIMSNGDIHPIDLHVGSRVRTRRKSLNISQTELAAGLGLTFQQVQKYERGLNRISASKLFEISRALKAPIAFFFEGYDGPAVGDHLRPRLPEQAVSVFIIKVWWLGGHRLTSLFAAHKPASAARHGLHWRPAAQTNAKLLAGGRRQLLRRSARRALAGWYAGHSACAGHRRAAGRQNSRCRLHDLYALSC